MSLTRDASTPRRARRAVAHHFSAHPRADELLLCVSEVVTNAVQHAGSPQRMRVSQTGQTVRIEVIDGDDRAPVLGEPGPLAASGRGLRIVDQLASRWGSDALPVGKAVWFEFDL